MDILSFNPDQFKVFFLILIRVSVVLFMFPIFGSNMVPVLTKVGLSLILSFLFHPVAGVSPALFPETPILFMTLIFSELIIGLVLGLTVRMFFAAVQLAGQIMGFQVGFSMINVLDPQTGTQVSILDQIGYWVVLLIFLSLNGHHMMITAISESFQLIRIGQIALGGELFLRVFSLSADIFRLAVKIGAPAITALIFTSAAFGLSAKFAPQMNILIAAFPVKIIVGLLFFGVSIQIMSFMTHAYMERFPSLLRAFLSWMGGG